MFLKIVNILLIHTYLVGWNIEFGNSIYVPYYNQLINDDTASYCCIYHKHAQSQTPLFHTHTHTVGVKYNSCVYFCGTALKMP